VDEVWSNGLQVDENIIELLQNEEATGHALSTRNSVTFRR
jgi:hypothetical protein